MFLMFSPVKFLIWKCQTAGLLCVTMCHFCPLDITFTEGCKTKEMSFISPLVVLIIPSHVNGAGMEASIILKLTFGDLLVFNLQAVNDYTVKIIRTIIFLLTGSQGDGALSQSDDTQAANDVSWFPTSKKLQSWSIKNPWIYHWRLMSIVLRCHFAQTNNNNS